MSTYNFLGSKFKSFKADGTVNASGTVEFFVVGGTFSTYLSSYTNSTLTVANTNTVTLDAAGEADVWLNSDADVRIKDSSGTILDTQININPSASTTSSNDNLVLNPSFEDDSNGDLQPDNWDVTTYTGGTAAIDNADRSHGKQCMKFVSVGNGGGTVTSTTFFPVNAGGTLYWSFDLKSTADVRNLVQILWYDASQVALGSPTSDLYDNSTTNPTSWTKQKGSVTVSATAYFAKIKIFGAHSSDVTAGTVRVDNVTLSSNAAPFMDIAFTGANTHSGIEEFTGIPVGKLYQPSNLRLSATVGSNALTVTLTGNDGNAPSSTNPVYVPFRNPTAATGDITWLKITAATSLVVSSGSTLGTTSAIANRAWIVGFNDASTFRLGIINCTTANILYALTDDAISSSTAEGGAGAADSAGVIYTGTAVSSKAMRVLGYVESTQATAGTWATTPSKVQLFTPGTPLPGSILQSIYVPTTALTTGTTPTPYDNTIPQSSEGIAWVSQAITPFFAGNRLVIEASAMYATSVGSRVAILALFQDATASALKAAMNEAGSGTAGGHVSLRHEMLAGTASSTTFATRIGPHAAATLNVNGDASAVAVFNGTAGSFVKITETMA